MIAFLRQLVLVAVSAAVSWWLLFGAELPPAPLAAAPEPAAPGPLSVAVMPEPVNAAQPAPARLRVLRRGRRSVVWR